MSVAVPPLVFPYPLTVSAVRNVLVAVGPDGGVEGGTCDRPVSPLMAMAGAASSSIVAARPTVSVDGFVIRPTDPHLLSLTRPLQLHAQSGSGFTLALTVQLAPASSGSGPSDSDNGGAPATYAFLFALEASSGVGAIAAFVMSGGSFIPTLYFCAQGVCATWPVPSLYGRTMAFAFRYTSLVKTLEIWEGATRVAMSAVRSC